MNTFSYRKPQMAASTSSLPMQFLLCYLFMQKNIQTNIKRKTLRSSRSQMFFKIAVLKNFAITVKKTPVLQCLFNKVAGLQACIFIKKDSNTAVFLRKFYELPFSQNPPHCSYYFFEILCDYRTFWTSLGTKLTFFNFLVPLL